MTTTALLLVDIQNDYFEGGRWPLDKMDQASAKAAQVLARARQNGTAIFHIRHEIPSETAPFFSPGSKGAEIHPSVAPQAGEEVILKHRPNSFHETGLQEKLKDQGIARLVIIGAQSQMCIDATARAAKHLVYDVTVLHDACAARDIKFGDETVPAAQVHAAFMGGLSGTYATVTACDTYLRAE